ncbi:hypothetical protein [Nocardia sp. NPDC005998]|uniref:PspA/IM30 family protein n=1 Tax=Nocardia sp. NPDC005998 TaxID=3156894 RepID=UPI0033A3720F
MSTSRILSSRPSNAAREVPTRRAPALAQLRQLVPQHDDLAAQQAELTAAAHWLRAPVRTFHTRKETIRASHTTAETHPRIDAAVTEVMRAQYMAETLDALIDDLPRHGEQSGPARSLVWANNSTSAMSPPPMNSTHSSTSTAPQRWTP